MKKVCFLITCIFMLLCLFVSCKGSDGSDNINLRNFFGTQYEELEEICNDEAQIEVANQIIEHAKEAFYFNSKDNANKNIEQLGALSKYIINSTEDIEQVDLNISLITTKQYEEVGYIWVKYSVCYKNDSKIIASSDNILSRWEIQKNFKSEWQVTNIKEMP